MKSFQKSRKKYMKKVLDMRIWFVIIITQISINRHRTARVYLATQRRIILHMDSAPFLFSSLKLSKIIGKSNALHLKHLNYADYISSSSHGFSSLLSENEKMDIGGQDNY